MKSAKLDCTVNKLPSRIVFAGKKAFHTISRKKKKIIEKNTIN